MEAGEAVAVENVRAGLEAGEGEVRWGIRKPRGVGELERREAEWGQGGL